MIRILSRSLLGVIIVSILFVAVRPCGAPALYPIFSYNRAPENPYENFAAGRLGIIKPTMTRAVLFAAYRYVNGGGFNAEEQKGLVDVWNATFKNVDFRDVDMGGAVKKYIDERKKVLTEEKKLPDAYAQSGTGYFFFPNCTQNAFETAAETLADRITKNGATDANVKNWVEAQDTVFRNCASGQRMPDPAPPGAPVWLQKDRAYQQAAAAFYALNYDDAKLRFIAIAGDIDSPWQDIAAYLVARTLIRQASMTQNKSRAEEFYKEAETRLSIFESRSNMYKGSVDGLRGLIAYRVRPQQRMQELARMLMTPGSGGDLRQNLIDYTWLLAKFEAQAREAADKAKAKAEGRPDPGTVQKEKPADPGVLELSIWLDDDSKLIRFTVPAEATDDDAIAAATNAAGQPLTDKEKESVISSRIYAYSGRFSDATNDSESYVSYYSENDLTLSTLPQFMRADELTDWIFTYQISDDEAYRHALQMFRSSRTDLWLMTAITKAKINSNGVAELIDAAERMSSSSPAYATVASYLASLYIQKGEKEKARVLLDKILSSTDNLPISTVNHFMELRQKINSSMDEYLRYSFRKPFAFDYDYTSGSIDDIIAQQKEYYDPEYDGDDRDAFNRKIDEEFAFERLWQDRVFFSERTIEEINQNFSTSVLIDLQSSAVLPDYLKEKVAVAAFTRALLLNDPALIERASPPVAAAMPGLRQKIESIINARSDADRQVEILYFLITDPMFSPYLTFGLGKADNEYEDYSGDNWWCEQYDQYWDEETKQSYSRSSLKKPAFLTAAQIQTSAAENQKIRELGDAPAFLSERTFELARSGYSDQRLAEMLYYSFVSNTWNKYGCGSDAEKMRTARELLNKMFPSSEWTRKAENWAKENGLDSEQ
jgi:hypothetical protein